MAKKQSHVHMYQRKDIGKTKPYIIYACGLPNCTHYIQAKFAMGKLSLCNKCGGEFTLDKYVVHAQRINPYCPDCRGTQKDDNPFKDLNL
jgi:hypothetical protein